MNLQTHVVVRLKNISFVFLFSFELIAACLLVPVFQFYSVMQITDKTQF